MPDPWKSSKTLSYDHQHHFYQTSQHHLCLHSFSFAKLDKFLKNYYFISVWFNFPNFHIFFHITIGLPFKKRTTSSVNHLLSTKSAGLLHKMKSASIPLNLQNLPSSLSLMPETLVPSQFFLFPCAPTSKSSSNEKSSNPILPPQRGSPSFPLQLSYFRSLLYATRKYATFSVLF